MALGKNPPDRLWCLASYVEIRGLPSIIALRVRRGLCNVSKK